MKLFEKLKEKNDGDKKKRNVDAQNGQNNNSNNINDVDMVQVKKRKDVENNLRKVNNVFSLMSKILFFYYLSWT